DEPDLELTPRTPHPLDFAPPAPIGDREAPPTPGASPHVLGFLPAETQRQGVTASVIFGIGMHLLLVLLVTAGILARSTAFTVGALLIGSAVVASLTAVGIGGNQLAGGALGSLADLARAARQIADGGRVRIPDV